MLRGKVLCPNLEKFGQSCWQIFWGTGTVESCPSKAGSKGWVLNVQRPQPRAWNAQGQLQGQSWSPRQPSIHRVCANTVEFICLFFFPQSSLFFTKKTFLISLHASPPQPLHESYLLSVIEKGWAGQASHSHFVQNPFCALLV